MKGGAMKVSRDEHGVPVRAVRRAFQCGAKDCGTRTFLRRGAPDSVPSCKDHGRMERLPNAPYLGVPTPV